MLANRNAFFEIRMHCAKVFDPSVRAQDGCSIGTFCGVSITDTAGSIEGKVGCVCSSFQGNSFHIESSSSLSSISGFPSGNSELCSAL